MFLEFVKWIINRRKKKKNNKLTRKERKAMRKKKKFDKKYPAKRRYPQHLGEEALHALYRLFEIPVTQVRTAFVKKGLGDLSNGLEGKRVNVTFISKKSVHFEVELDGETISHQLPHHALSFGQPIDPIRVKNGEWFKLLSQISSDDKTKEIFGFEGEDVVLIKALELDDEFDYVVHHFGNNLFFRVKEEEVKRLHQILPTKLI